MPRIRDEYDEIARSWALDYIADLVPQEDIEVIYLYLGNLLREKCVSKYLEGYKDGTSEVEP